MQNAETKADKVARLILSAQSFIETINEEISGLKEAIEETLKGRDNTIFVANSGNTRLRDLTYQQVAYYYGVKSSALAVVAEDEVFNEYCKLMDENAMLSPKVLREEVGYLGTYMNNYVKRDALKDQLSDKQFVRSTVLSRQQHLEALQVKLAIAPEGLLDEMEDTLGI